MIPLLYRSDDTSTCWRVKYEMHLTTAVKAPQIQAAAAGIGIPAGSPVLIRPPFVILERIVLVLILILVIPIAIPIESTIRVIILTVSLILSITALLTLPAVVIITMRNTGRPFFHNGIIGFLHFRKLFLCKFCQWIPGMIIRMILLCQFTISMFDLIICCCRANPQNIIRISC